MAAAASLALLGHGTVAARAPFALAALGTILLLYLLARRTFEDRWIATASAALLVANAYWILHMRQCRYYALSSLALLLSVAAAAIGGLSSVAERGRAADSPGNAVVFQRGTTVRHEVDVFVASAICAKTGCDTRFAP